MIDFLDQTLLQLGASPTTRYAVRAIALGIMLFLAIWALGYAPGRFKYLHW